MYRDYTNIYFKTECHVTEGGDTPTVESFLSADIYINISNVAKIY